ncbi:MAG: peptidoglycan DD-metalloendopeptidase family protein [Candidatus Udaeobacter sp.]
MKFSFNKIDSTASPVSSPADDRARLAAKKAATEFEALLLTQLTASLNPKDDGDEESIFGGGGGMSLSRQMFSEQIAVAMSKAGGIGLADSILQKINPGYKKPNPIEGLRTLASELKGLSASPSRFASDTRPIKASPSTSGKPPTVPASVSNNGNYPEATVISEFPVTDSLTARNGASPSDVVRPRLVTQPSASDTVAPIFSPTTSPFPGTDGLIEPVTLRMPVQGRITSDFGGRRDPVNGRQRFHEGIDIAAPKGTPIQSAATGTVIYAGRNGGYGNTILVQHADGRITRYAHAESLMVNAGDTVEAGQTIAAVGSTGHSTGPHLHFEVIENGRHVSPLKVLANDFALARR